MNAHTTSWTDERLEKLKAGVAAGLSFSAIAAEINRLPGAQITRNAALGKYNRLGLPRPDRTEASPPVARGTGRPKAELDPARADLIRKLYAGGMLYAQMCERLGMSRGALSKTLTDLGLTGDRCKPKTAALPAESWAIIDPVLRENWPDNVPTETILDRLRLQHPDLVLPSPTVLAVRASNIGLKRTNLGQVKVLSNAARGDMIEQRFFDRVEDGMLFSNTVTPLVRDMLAFALVSDDAGVGILDLKLEQCRFILGRTAAGHERYCGGRCHSVRGRVAVWCDSHKKRVLTPAGLKAANDPHTGYRFHPGRQKARG